MNYHTFEPGYDLDMLIRCYWTLESPGTQAMQKQRIVPDGCMEMIFHAGDLYKQYLSPQEYIIQPRCFVIGQLTVPLEIEPTGATGIFAVRFHPDGFMPFATLPVKEMANRAVPLEELFAGDGLKLEQDILQANSTEERIRIAEAFLLNRIRSAETIDRVVRATVDMMMEIKGQLSIEDLSGKVHVSRKQLERKFSAAIGLSPKQLAKTIRLQAALKMLLNKNFINLTTLAHEGEYYDQAHFIKDFKEFTGLTPGRFYGDHLEMSSLFYGAG